VKKAEPEKEVKEEAIVDAYKMPKVEEPAVTEEAKIEESIIQPDEPGIPRCRHLFYFILGALVVLALVMYFKPSFIMGECGATEQVVEQNVEVTKYICPDGQETIDKTSCNLNGLKVICCDGTVVQKKEYCLNKDCFTN
jgi:hypothetical protein